MEIEALEEIKTKVHLALPFTMFEKYLPRVLEWGLSLEVGLDHQALDLYRIRDFRHAASLLKRQKIKCTVHAPFCDISPGAFDGLVRRASIKRLQEALRVARYFEPEVVVFHSGYHPGYHRERKEAWLDLVKAGIAEVLALAEKWGLCLALENVFESAAALLTNIVEEINSPFLGYCFDAGHAFAFAKSSWRPWLEAFEERLLELHVHDNEGHWDDHLPPGRGKIPFEEIFKFLVEKGRRPVVTFEAHREEDVLPGYLYLKELFSKISW